MANFLQRITSGNKKDLKRQQQPQQPKPELGTEKRGVLHTWADWNRGGSNGWDKSNGNTGWNGCVVGDGCGELALLVGRTLPPVLRFDRRITGETNCDININD
ncbi:uncharacterized protein ZBAI_08189 [Zygosaccharomyces bailii ISA1307]|nr:uncharacterized protein ZBAI_08189 [Zygosaccharomyces bailii ISA1307]